MLAFYAAALLLAFTSPAAADPISIAILGAVGISATTTAVAITTTLITTALSIGLSFAAKALSPKPKSGGAAADSSTMVTIREPLAPRRRVYGRMRMGGKIAYVNSNSGVLSMPVMLCDGPVADIEKIYFDDIELEIDGGGVVRNGPFATFAVVKKFLGTVGQPADADIIYYSGGAWTSAHRLDGIAYISPQLIWDPSAWTGVPNITAVVKGVSVYDPRTADTTWSDNPALILRDFLLLSVENGGVGASSSEIDEASFIAAANICDESVPKGGGGTEKRYTANGIVELDEGSSPQAVVQSILTSCAGRLSYWGGKWHLTVGAWQSPSFTITDDLLRGPLTVDTRISRRDQFNAVKGAYREPDDRYIARDFPPITFPAFEAEDGGTRIYKDLPLDWTTSASMAQRLAKIELYRSREPITVQAQCKIAAYSVVVGDVVNLTHARWGWTNKTFEVIDVKWAIGDDLAPGIDLVLRETSAAVYDWQASEEQLIAAAPATNFPNWITVPTPAFTLAAGDAELFVAGDGAVQSRIKVTILPAAYSFTDSYEIRWKQSTEATFNDPVTIGAAGSNVWWISPINDGALYDVAVRAVSALGGRSPWAYVVNFLAVGKTAPPPDVTAVSISDGVLRWDYPNPPADLAGFQVRYHSGSFVFWGSGLAAHSGLLSAGAIDVGALLTGPVTLMVKAVDTSGNESVNAAVVVTDLGDRIVDNVLVDYDLRAAGFPGTIAAGTISGGDLVGASGAVYWSSNSRAPFWPPAQPLFWPADVYGNVDYSWTYTPALDLVGSTLSIASTIAGSPWAITYREAGSSAFYDATDGDLYWSDEGSTFDDVLLEDNVSQWLMEDNVTPISMETPLGGVFWLPVDYQPWPGAIGSVRRVTYEFRLTVSGGAVQPDVSALRMIFDVPDVMETLGDVAVLAAGTRLPLTKTFRAITAVNLTVQAGPNAAVTARIEDKSLIGPLVTARNAAGTAVDASIDAIVQGY